MSKEIEEGHKAFAEFLTKAIERVSYKYSQVEISKKIGYKQPSILSIMKNGDAKLPITKIAPLAEILEVDLPEFFRLALRQYYAGDDLNNVIKCFSMLPPDEERILSLYRAKRDEMGRAMTEKEFAIATIEAL